MIPQAARQREREYEGRFFQQGYHRWRQSSTRKQARTHKRPHARKEAHRDREAPGDTSPMISRYRQEDQRRPISEISKDDGDDDDDDPKVNDDDDEDDDDEDESGKKKASRSERRRKGIKPQTKGTRGFLWGDGKTLRTESVGAAGCRGCGIPYWYWNRSYTVIYCRKGCPYLPRRFRWNQDATRGRAGK